MAGSLALTACSGETSAGSGAAELPTGLEPSPLAEPTTLTVTMGNKVEPYAPFLLADKLGEFAKENIKINLVQMSSSDSIPSLAQGKTDMASAGVGAAFFNAVAGGADIRMVFPGALKNPADGLYVAVDPATGEPREVTKIATISGPGNVYVIPIARYLESVGKSVNDVAWEKVELPDMFTAMENGAVDAAWVNTPVTSLFEESGRYKRVVGYEAGEFGTAYFFGPRLLKDRPEVGQAVVRALARTIRDHLSGDYKADEETLTALASAEEVEPDVLLQSPSFTFAAELPTEALQRAQQTWLGVGDLLEYDAPLEPSAYTDPTFLQRAMGTS